MRTRKVLAAAVLAALPLFVGAPQPAPILSEADAAGATHVTGRASGPRALWWAGIDGGTAIAAGLLAGLDTFNAGIALGTAL